MKSSYLKLIFSAIGLFIFTLSCTPELDVQEDFGFSIKTNHKTDGYVAELNNNTLTIEPERMVEGTKYFLSYKVLEGDGSYQLEDGSILEQDQEYELKSLSIELNYFPKSSDDHNTRITIRDSNANERLIELAYDILFPRLNFSGTLLKNTLYVDESTEISFSISQATEYNQDYSMSFEMSSGNVLIEDEKGNKLNAGTYYPIPYGNFTWKVQNKSNRTIDLVFSVKNSVGNQKKEDISINTIETGYNFTAIANTNSAEIEELVPVNFSINQFGYEKLDYILKFTSSKNVSMLYEGREYKLGEIIDVSKGNFVGYLQFSEIGNTNIEFLLDSSINKPKSWDVSLNISKYIESFDYELIVEDYKKIKGKEFTIIPTINTNAHRASTKYYVQCNLDSRDQDGYIMYKNKRYSNNENFEIDYHETSINIVSSTDENHEITFRIFNSTDVADIVTKSITIDMLKTLEISAFRTSIKRYNTSRRVPNRGRYGIGGKWGFRTIDEDYTRSDIHTKLEILNKSTNKYDVIDNPHNTVNTSIDGYVILEFFDSHHQLINDYNDQTYRATFTDPEGNQTVKYGTFTEEDHDAY